MTDINNININGYNVTPRDVLCIDDPSGQVVIECACCERTIIRTSMKNGIGNAMIIAMRSLENAAKGHAVTALGRNEFHQVNLYHTRCAPALDPARALPSRPQYVNDSPQDTRFLGCVQDETDEIFDAYVTRCGCITLRWGNRPEECKSLPHEIIIFSIKDPNNVYKKARALL